jgi:hypothetical protein
MNIYDAKNQPIIKAIKFCLNYNPDYMKLKWVEYKVNREIYKCRVLDHKFGGIVTIHLQEKFVRSAVNWLKNGGMAEWSKAAVLKTVGGQTSGGSNPSPSSTRKD